MRKILYGGGVLILLSFLVTTANAKSLPSFSLTLSPTNDLSDRLAADKDFQEFAIGVYNLIAKIQETKSGNLFVKYFQNSISEEDQLKLLTALGYSTNNEFRSFLKVTYEKNLSVNARFKLLSIDNAKLAIEQAADKVVKEILKPVHTVADCWLLFVSGMSACFQGCPFSYDPEACYDYCYALVISSSSTCFLFAD